MVKTDGEMCNEDSLKIGNKDLEKIVEYGEGTDNTAGKANGESECAVECSEGIDLENAFGERERAEESTNTRVDVNKEEEEEVVSLAQQFIKVATYEIVIIVIVQCISSYHIILINYNKFRIKK